MVENKKEEIINEVKRNIIIIARRLGVLEEDVMSYLKEIYEEYKNKI